MKRNILIATVAAAALVGGGTAVAFAGGDEARQERAVDVRDDSAEARTAKVTAAEAIGAALKAQPGTAVGADLDADVDDSDDSDDSGDSGDSDDFRGWEVEILGAGAKSYTVQVDPATAKIVGTQVENDDDDEDDRDRAASGTTAQEAAEAAAAEGFVTSLDLEDDDRTTTWDAETRNARGAESHWNIDLNTAKVTADRSDDASDD
ncbi:PepSY domain-containing protein [Streptomyces sp. NPDC003635]